MKTINVTEATGAALDWLVAKCEGHDVVILTVQEQRDRWFEDVPPEKLAKETREYDLHFAPLARPEIRIKSDDGYKRTPHHSEAPMLYGEGIAKFQYSTSHAQGGPIIHRDKISVLWRPERSVYWACYGGQDPADEEVLGADGATYLEAAMRCRVMAKLGEEVEVPDELV
jgi:hypothetical protein